MFCYRIALTWITLILSSTLGNCSKAIVIFIMSNFIKRFKDKVHKVLRDEFGFFLPLGRRTLIAVEYALKNNIGGHYYEFGLYQGYTFYHAVKHSPSIHHFGFDSFEGMPENDEGGGFFASRFKVTYRKVINNLLKNDAFSYKEHLIKGYFSESLTSELQNELMNYRPGVVLIDSDLYSSALEVLVFLKPLFQEGTIVIFDDWHSFGSDAGEQAALKDYLGQNNEYSFEEIKECDSRMMFRLRRNNI